MFVAGDRQACNSASQCFPNFYGAGDFTAIIFRGDASVDATGTVPSPQWQHLTNTANLGIAGGGTATASAPHADARDMEFRADGSILEGDDGGITIRTNPSDNTGDWFGLCGDLQVFETHNVAFDPLFRVVVFGNQDTGTVAGTIGMPDSYTEAKVLSAFSNR